MSSIACIKWIKIGSSSFKPTLIVGLLLASSQVDCPNPCIAFLIFLALDLVIGPSGTYKGSLRLGPTWFPSKRILAQGDLVLCKVLGSKKDPTQGKLGVNWEGLYQIISEAKLGAFNLAGMDDKPLKGP